VGGGAQAAGGADVLARILSEARASYDADYEGSAIVSGERCHVIALTPTGQSDYRRVRIWIADGDRLVRRFRIEERNETIRTVTLAELEPNVAMDDALFVFEVPPGVQVFDREDSAS
jgi:outer membrane lipoprotein-sorting protein